jgi:hypothetical protein
MLRGVPDASMSKTLVAGEYGLFFRNDFELYLQPPDFSGGFYFWFVEKRAKSLSLLKKMLPAS